MPKIIENLRETIMVYGRNQLLASGFKALTMRQIAVGCNIATGTVYNYFPSKDILVASIMMEDWQTGLAAAKEQIANTESALDVLHFVFNAIHDFSQIYRGVWRAYGPMENTGTADNYHARLIHEISDILATGLNQFNCPQIDELSKFLAEILLNIAIRNDVPFDAVSPFLQKLIN